ncbi:unnamed protein product [Bursaphelenchus okinawaensis]|uniref:EF-hand domain-containing protein n=1 Tax=Bursaphelenchus okinawaensis TaxID=465554 RepID=A0A811LBF7_9BILA|nr:unnamed protein product [Bursaphelenchus okinawaensis]CAG9120266.1 unnamed protein product [Bursaphelenchus okinawaensis]
MSTSNSGDSDDPDRPSTADDSQKWSEDDNSDSMSESEDENNSTATETDSAEARRRAKLAKRVRQHQSDTETRNLLDDVGDGEDDILDLEETKEPAIDTKFFEMSDEQLDYYTNCFLHLQRKTQGQATMGGAVSGAEDTVVDFFRKSKLDTHTLSKVWALADVNEDGFLNHSEFVIAMHLIVLHVKGSVPIPPRLPSPVRPCPTPVRRKLYSFKNSNASSTLTTSGGGYSNDTASTSKGLVNSTSHSDTNENNKQHSLSDDHIHSYVQQCEHHVTDFSDAPPVLVDNRPQPLNPQTNSKGLAFLNALSAKGPPPQPPPRDYHNKGHGRSASLDLKAFSGTTIGIPSRVPLPSQQNNPANQGSFSSEIQSQSYSLYTTDLSKNPSGPHSGAGGSLPAIHDRKVVHPPLPPHRTIEKKNETTQTDPEEPIILDSDVMSALLTDMENMTVMERCEMLRKYNAELEAEKATLAQIQLQLQLRIEEAVNTLKTLGIDQSLRPTKQSSSSVKPTAL